MRRRGHGEEKVLAGMKTGAKAVGRNNVVFPASFGRWMKTARKAIRQAGLALAAGALAVCAGVLADDAAMRDSSNIGEDFTRPVGRFDLRQRYERLPDVNELEPAKWVTTLRVDLWTGFSAGWRLYGRVDQPLVYSNDVTSRFNPNGHSRFGQGDLLTELGIIAPPPTARLGYGMGVRAVWPTAGLNEAGAGKYQLDPWSAPAPVCRKLVRAASCWRKRPISTASPAVMKTRGGRTSIG